MSMQPRPPIVPEKLRMPLRITSVVIAYIVFRVLEGRSIAGAISVAVGLLVLDWSIIDRLTKHAPARLEMMEVASGVLATGLLGVGVYLVAS